MRNLTVTVQIQFDQLGGNETALEYAEKKLDEMSKVLNERFPDISPLIFTNSIRQQDVYEALEDDHIYYQPDLDHPDTEDLWSFQVFHSKENAQKAFPNVEIKEYRGDEIGDHTFMD